MLYARLFTVRARVLNYRQCNEHGEKGMSKDVRDERRVRSAQSSLQPVWVLCCFGIFYMNNVKSNWLYSMFT